MQCGFARRAQCPVEIERIPPARNSAPTSRWCSTSGEDAGLWLRAMAGGPAINVQNPVAQPTMTVVRIDMKPSRTVACASRSIDRVKRDTPARGAPLSRFRTQL
ncbi:hypothetical protein GCM10023196_066980 [Actinoallomurus vinaceus]|uniref:Uncharacterized protein n=1 Tax=Actinoallomurus vinaceus TaxID=1080074 RepID=A0ABP8UHZ1_9ACTN